jgi:hypothetical protein
VYSTHHLSSVSKESPALSKISTDRPTRQRSSELETLRRPTSSWCKYQDRKSKLRGGVNEQSTSMHPTTQAFLRQIWLCPASLITNSRRCSTRQCSRAVPYLIFTADLPTSPAIATATFADDIAILASDSERATDSLKL